MSKQSGLKKNKLHSNFISLFILSLLFFISTPKITLAWDFMIDSGLKRSASQAGYEVGANAETVDSTVSLIISIALGLVAVIFFGLILYHGIKWMISFGNEDKIRKAKDSLENSLVGLAITLGAYVITHYIFAFFN